MPDIQNFIDTYTDYLLTENDKSFLKRVFSYKDDRYVRFLEELGIKEFGSVIDIGGGFGQWSIALSKLNKKITYLEPSLQRNEFFKKLVSNLKLNNVLCAQANVGALKGENFYDAIFSYGVVFLTEDWKITIENMFHSLNKSGYVFFNFCTIDWFIYLWNTNHNKNDNYCPKEVVYKSFHKTFVYESSPQNASTMGGQYIMQEEEVTKKLFDLGFKNVYCQRESDIWKKVLKDQNDILCQDRGIYFITAQKQ